MFPLGLDKVKAEELQKTWAFNKMASDKISLWRSLGDMRSGQCKALTYVLDNLPTSSVVIIFNNGDTSFYSQVTFSRSLMLQRRSPLC